MVVLNLGFEISFNINLEISFFMVTHGIICEEAIAEGKAIWFICEEESRRNNWKLQRPDHWKTRRKKEPLRIKAIKDFNMSH
jgi:hypothetical protein